MWLRLLRRKFSTRNPLVLVFESLRPKGRDIVGYCESSEGGHLVTIDDVNFRGPVTFFLDTLIHEYAHALQYEEPGPEGDDHDDRFGIIYARLLRYGYSHRMWP